VAAAVVATFLVQGCGVRIGDDEPRQAWDEWDLREPPTRAEVGIPDGRTTVIYQDSPDSVQTVTVRLPEDTVLRLRANSVSFSALGSLEPTTSQPSAMDIGSGLLPLDEALDQMAASLRELDLPTDAADDWYREAAATRGADRAESAWVSTQLGYLTVAVQGRYSALDETAVVAYALSW
jgi:hypothetical protein